MKLITLTPWASARFAFVHGDLIEVPENVGRDRLAAGLMRKPTRDELETRKLHLFPGMGKRQAGKPKATVAHDAPQRSVQ